MNTDMTCRRLADLYPSWWSGKAGYEWPNCSALRCFATARRLHCWCHLLWDVHTANLQVYRSDELPLGSGKCSRFRGQVQCCELKANLSR